MKRPELVAVFAPVNANIVATADSVLRLFENELHGYPTFDFFARIKYIADGNYYRFEEETPRFENRQGLLRSIEATGSGMWSMMSNFGFAPAEIYPAVLPAAQDASKSITILTIDAQITRWVETEESTQVPFVMVLVRLSKAIGSNWFYCVPDMERWRSFDMSGTYSHADMCNPYVVGWMGGTPEEEKLISDLNLPPDNIFNTIHKFKFSNFIPDFS